MKKPIIISVIVFILLSSAALAGTYYPIKTSTLPLVQKTVSPAIKTTPLCIEGTTRCYDNNFQKCKNGNWMTLDKCSSLEKCDSLKGCVLEVKPISSTLTKPLTQKVDESLMQGCVYGDTRCHERDDGTWSYQVCINNEWILAHACREGQVCREEHGCIDAPSRAGESAFCEPGAHKCVGNMWQVCNNQRVWIPADVCSANEVCNPARGCEPRIRQIEEQEPRQLAVCREGETKCFNNIFKRCRNNEWVAIDTCSRGSECNDIRGCVLMTPQAPPETEQERCAGPGMRADLYGGRCCEGLILQGGLCNLPRQQPPEQERCAGPGMRADLHGGRCCEGLILQGGLCNLPREQQDCLTEGQITFMRSTPCCPGLEPSGFFGACRPAEGAPPLMPPGEAGERSGERMPPQGEPAGFDGQGPQGPNGEGPQGPDGDGQNGEPQDDEPFEEDDNPPWENCCDEMEECCEEMQDCCEELRERVERLEQLIKKILTDKCSGPGHKPDVYTGRCCPGLVIMNGICSVPQAVEEKPCAKEGLRADMYGGCCEGLVKQGGICVMPEKPLCAGPGLMASRFGNVCCPGLVKDAKGSCTLPIAPADQCAKSGLRADMYGGRCCEGLVEVQGICKTK